LPPPRLGLVSGRGGIPAGGSHDSGDGGVGRVTSRGGGLRARWRRERPRMAVPGCVQPHHGCKRLGHPEVGDALPPEAAVSVALLFGLYGLGAWLPLRIVVLEWP